jgi:nucleotide-binding universal stress UspA family protein
MAPVPVLVVKNFYLGPIRNIIFPCSLQTEWSNAFIEKIKELQKFFRAHLHLVRINTPENFSKDMIVEESLQKFINTYALEDYTVSIYNDFNETDGILHFTEAMKGDLIVMATHGRRGIAHLFYGSIAEHVVNHAPNLIWTFVSKGVHKEHAEQIEVDQENVHVK